MAKKRLGAPMKEMLLAKCSSRLPSFDDSGGLQIWQTVEKWLLNRCITVLWPTTPSPGMLGASPGSSTSVFVTSFDVVRFELLVAATKNPVIWSLLMLNDFNFMMLHVIVVVFWGSFVVTQPKWRSIFDEVYVHFFFTRSLKSWTCP